MSTYVRKVKVPNITVRCDEQGCSWKRIVWGRPQGDPLHLAMRACLTLRAHQQIHRRKNHQ